ncbi:MAG: cytochrome c biogenesis protein CcdA, partial [Acidobacteriota bacterium]
MKFRPGQFSLNVSLILGILTTCVGAQGLNPIKFSARAEPAEVKSGEKARIILTATIDPSWHLYSLTQPPGGPRPTRIAIDEASPVTLIGAPRQPKPRVAPDPNFSTPGQPPFLTETFENKVDFSLDVEVKPAAPAGATKVILKVSYQACDDHQCLPPRTRPVETDLVISGTPVSRGGDPLLSIINSANRAEKQEAPALTDGGGGSGGQPVPSETAAAAATTPPQETAASPPPPDGRDRGLLGYILFAMGVGFLSLLTPCVFPMIPITVSFFTKKEERSTGEAVKQAVIYCLGIILTFTGLGLALTLIAGPAGINRVAASPWMNIFLTTLFVVFALNLFGLFEIQIPSRLLNRLDR